MRALAFLLVCLLLAGCLAAKGPQPHMFDDPFHGKGAPASAMVAVNATRALAAREHPGAHLAYVTGVELRNATGILAPWDVFYVDENMTEDYWYVAVNGSATPGGMPFQALPAGFPARSIEGHWAVDSPAAASTILSGDPEFARLSGASDARVRFELMSTPDGAGAAWHARVDAGGSSRDQGSPA